MTVFVVMAMPMGVMGTLVVVTAIVLAVIVVVVSMTRMLCAHGPCFLKSRALRTATAQK